MTLLPEGGAALPVSVTTTRKVQGGSAIPVYGYMTAPTDGRPAMGGSAIPVRVLTAADLKQNGGQWTLEGRPYAMPVYTAPATTTVLGGPALAVYPVNAWPTVPVVPAWVPTDIAGLALWLKADAGLFKDAAKAQPCTADADAVYTWEDQSGNGRDAVQATAGARPAYRVNIQNSKPMVRGDGNDDFLATGSFALPQPITVFMVYQDIAPTGNTRGFFCGRAVNQSEIYTLTGPPAKLQCYANGPGPFLDHNITTGTTYIITLTFAGASSSLQLNNDAATTGNPGTTALDGVALFNRGIVYAGWSQCYLGEVIVYSSALSAGNISLVKTYLNTRWAVY